MKCAGWEFGRFEEFRGGEECKRKAKTQMRCVAHRRQKERPSFTTRGQGTAAPNTHEYLAFYFFSKIFQPRRNMQVVRNVGRLTTTKQPNEIEIITKTPGPPFQKVFSKYRALPMAE